MSFSKLDRRQWLSLNVSIGVFMSTLDASIVNISLPTVIETLHTNVKAGSWVVIAYLIIITGCLLLMGRLTDLWGQRTVYLFGFSAFTLGSALCGLSPVIYFLIGSRVVQGFGAAALMASGPAIITSAFPDSERGKALGLIGSVVSAGFLTGPLLGGFLVEHLGWRSVFFINLPIGAIGLLLSARVLEKGRRDQKVPLDIKGALLLFLFLASLLLFLNGVARSTAYLFWGWLGLSVLSCTAFVATELRTASPLVDLRLFRNRLFSSSLGASFLAFWMSAAHSFVIPFYLQTILGFSPSKVGMLVFPVSVTVMLLAPWGGKFSDRVGVTLPATLGLTLTSAVVFSFVFVGKDSAELSIIWRQIALGIGIVLFNPANNSAIIGSLPREKIGLASSFLALSRNLGMVVGVACAELVIAMRSSPLSPAKGTPSLESIEDVWTLTLIIGLSGAFISWSRGGGRRSGRSVEIVL
jgi:EmrB/QacA subfamily drug resistance transporter